MDLSAHMLLNTYYSSNTSILFTNVSEMLALSSPKLIFTLTLFYHAKSEIKQYKKTKICICFIKYIAWFRFHIIGLY